MEIAQERGSDMFNITVELNEEDVTQLVEEALHAESNPLMQDPVVDLQNGQIEVTGQHDRRDGSGLVNGRVVIIPSVQDDHLMLEAIEINIDGVEVSEERIAQFNDNLAQRISERAEQRSRNITFTDVSVTESELVLLLEATQRN